MQCSVAQMEDELHGGRFLKKIENFICKFKKIRTKILGLDNGELYHYKKISIENSSYYGLHNNDKSDKFSYFKNKHCSSHLDPHTCHFFWD
jgi:hypothetical protein